MSDRTILTDWAYIRAMACRLDGETDPEMVEHRQRLDAIADRLQREDRASMQAEAPQATKDAARFRSVLEEISAMTFDEWTNGAIAGRMAQGALDAARKSQGEAP